MKIRYNCRVNDVYTLFNELEKMKLKNKYNDRFYHYYVSQYESYQICNS
jgi:hypothetical protein